MFSHIQKGLLQDKISPPPWFTSEVNTSGYSRHLLLWYSDRPLRRESATVIKTEPYAKEAAGVAAHQC